MPFFSISTNPETGSETWAMSSTFWIYWAITTPITVVTISCWLIWQFWESRLLGGQKSVEEDKNDREAKALL